MSDAVRQNKRYTARQGLQIRCETWAEFATLYASDVSQGGMFLVTDEPLPILSRIELRLQLPEGHEIVLDARVVHVIDAQQAAAEGKHAGVGVEFVELDEVRKREIHQLVEFARWEGGSGNTSFAKSMFEQAGSLSAADVIASLPPVPTLPKPSQPTPSRPESQPGSRPGSVPSGRPRVRAKRAGDTTYRSMPVVQDDLSTPSTRPRAASARPAAEADAGKGEGEESVEATDTTQASKPPEPKPTDMVKLKQGMKHFARRRYHEAIDIFRGMLEDNPGDPEALKWLHMAQARISVFKEDEESAVQHYKRVLEYDEGHHEALKYVRSHGRRGLAGSLTRLFKRR